MSSRNSNTFRLMQPNLLSKEEIIANLQYRCIKLDNMGGMSKDQLVDIFNRVVTPLEQRITRRTSHTPSYNHENISMDCSDYSEVITGKRIRLISETNGNENLVQNHITLKRKINECKVPTDITPNKKSRQRICWP